MADTRTISSKVSFVNYVDNDGKGGSAAPGDELDVSNLSDSEVERLEEAGAFADAEVDPTRRGSDMDGHSFVDDREADDTETPVPPENGGVVPLSEEEAGGSDYEAMSKSELEELADSRDLDVEGSGAGGSVTKADLVAALEEDDRS